MLAKFVEVQPRKRISNKLMLNEVLSTNDALKGKTESEGLSSSALWAQL